MFDTYLKSRNRQAFEGIRAFAVNVIGPVQGTAQTLDDDGNTVPAIGDPDYWYVCVRFFAPIGAAGEIEACAAQEGMAVCGVWA
jgi:hypothetical protein